MKNSKQSLTYNTYNNPVRVDNYNWNTVSNTWQSFKSNILITTPYYYISIPYASYADITYATISGTENTAAVAEYKLSQNYPNPFNPITTISYSLKEPGKVSLSIYNQIGQRIAVLVDKEESAGGQKVTWNASGLSSGVYFYELKSGNYREIKKLTLLK